MVSDGKTMFSQITLFPIGPQTFARKVCFPIRKHCFVDGNHGFPWENSLESIALGV